MTNIITESFLSNYSDKGASLLRTAHLLMMCGGSKNFNIRMPVASRRFVEEFEEAESDPVQREIMKNELDNEEIRMANTIIGNFVAEEAIELVPRIEFSRGERIDSPGHIFLPSKAENIWRGEGVKLEDKVIQLAVNPDSTTTIGHELFTDNGYFLDHVPKGRFYFSSLGEWVYILIEEKKGMWRVSGVRKKSLCPAHPSYQDEDIKLNALYKINNVFVISGGDKVKDIRERPEKKDEGKRISKVFRDRYLEIADICFDYDEFDPFGPSIMIMSEKIGGKRAFYIAPKGREGREDITFYNHELTVYPKTASIESRWEYAKKDGMVVPLGKKRILNDGDLVMCGTFGFIFYKGNLI